MQKFDIAVIGGGPGGYVAAIKAAQNGALTVLIEKDELGGTCLNTGCIPTKTLIASAEVLGSARDAAKFGVKISGEIVPDITLMQKRKNSIVRRLRTGIATLVKANKITLIKGSASFKTRKQIQIFADKEVTIEAQKIIVATGSEPLVPSFIPKSDKILDSTQILEIKDIPKSLIILGGGVIGCEFACLLAELGTSVTVVEMLETILPSQDKDVCTLITKNMKKKGIKVLTGAPLEKIKASSSGVSGNVAGKNISADYMLVSIGRKPVTTELNIDNTGIKIDDNGFIPVNNQCKTNISGIYAIGDLTGEIQLAHMASAMGICAANNASGKKDEFKSDLVPSCIFTTPEIGSVGMTEAQCKEKNVEIKIGQFPFAALGKAMALDKTEGFVKIIADKETGQILGTHIVGPSATDLIAESATAMNLEITAEELGKAIHAHPTLGEASMEAAHAVDGECIHLPPK
ncbi:MAG: dihydrolipoyl dehydrogenase [Verrucomicrobiota bacterium]|nr:dihydrolipoyl dehydrogenase [Verrucomicrobiota bacterium]